MREIKFRAWNKHQRQMNYFGLFEDDGSEYGADIIMQYTGLKDRNGKEIFEGDILGYWENATWEVLWVDEKSAFRFGNYVTNFPLTECKRKEIIGNIYENSELLK